MAQKSKNQAVKESFLSVADSEKRYSWFDDVKGSFELYRAEDNKSGGLLSHVSINRVPIYLKGLNRDAYEPRLVSLGLLHRKVSQPLSEIEHYKVEAVNRTVERLPQNQQHARFLVEQVRRLLPKCTESYEVKIECEEEILAWVFTLDGCFLIETLRLLNNGNGSQWKLDPVFNRNRIRSCQFDILTDILMLENQVPIILLIGLLEMEEHLTEEDARTELLRMICDGIIALAHPFSYSLQRKTGETEAEHTERESNLRKDLQLKYKDLEKYNHILGFFHDFIVQETQGTLEGGKTEDVRITLQKRHHHPRLRRHKTGRHKKPSHYQTIMASATELYKSGMKFVSYEGVPSAKSLRFEKEKKTLFLPTIWISDSTEVVFRNLMAVDVCQEEELSVISEYVFLMNSLIKSEADVALLRKKGIIQSSIGTDKEASELFNSLGKGVNFHIADQDEFMDLKFSVNKWYKSRYMVKFGEFLEKNPKFVRTFSMFWGVTLVLVAAVPSLLQILKQLSPNINNNV